MTHRGSFSATSESSTVSGCSPLKMGMDIQERCAASHVLVRPRYKTVIAAGEGHVCFWTNLTQVN